MNHPPPRLAPHVAVSCSEFNAEFIKSLAGEETEVGTAQPPKDRWHLWQTHQVGTIQGKMGMTKCVRKEPKLLWRCSLAVLQAPRAPGPFKRGRGPAPGSSKYTPGGTHTHPEIVLHNKWPLACPTHKAACGLALIPLPGSDTAWTQALSWPWFSIMCSKVELPSGKSSCSPLEERLQVGRAPGCRRALDMHGESKWGPAGHDTLSISAPRAAPFSLFIHRELCSPAQLPKPSLSPPGNIYHSYSFI